MKKQTTFYPKSDQIKEEWFLLDASEQILGRVASRAAKIVSTAWFNVRRKRVIFGTVKVTGPPFCIW